MKTTLAFLRFPAVLAALAAFALIAPAAETKKAPPKPADLQVLIDIPPTWRPFLDDDIAEALYFRVREVFRQRGYKGELAQLTRFDEAKPDVPTLQLNLTEWRIDRIGNAQCTMTAQLKTSAAEKSLGLATGTALFWSHGDRWTVARQMETADALEDAANNAAREVYEAVAKSGLVAGLPAKK